LAQRNIIFKRQINAIEMLFTIWKIAWAIRKKSLLRRAQAAAAGNARLGREIAIH
jgi:hypothetical protein